MDCEGLDPLPLECLAGRDYSTTVKVTNDVAERGVKIASDFATMLTKDDSVRAMLLQGVEKSRKLHPNFKKQTLNSYVVTFQLFTT